MSARLSMYRSSLVALVAVRCQSSPEELGEVELAVQQTCVTLTATDDAKLLQAQMNSNFGNKQTLQAGQGAESLVRFNLGSIPTNAAIQTSTMKLYVTDTCPNTTVTVHRA